jgi:hypothetical protein
MSGQLVEDRGNRPKDAGGQGLRLVEDKDAAARL